MTTRAPEVPSGEVRYERITDELKALEILEGQPLKNTKQSLRLDHRSAWIDVEVYGREVGFHQHTNHYAVDINLADFLVLKKLVEPIHHLPEAGGTKLELSKEGTARLAMLRQLSSTESDLAKLMRFIGERYMFTPEHYPAMAALSPEQQKAFAVGHGVHHMMKSLGRIAEEVERSEHGGSLDHSVLKEGIVKMLINTLKLAEELGMSASDISDAVPRSMKSK